VLFRETFDLVIRDRKTQTTRPLEWYLWYKDKVGMEFWAESGDRMRKARCMINEVAIATLGEIASNPEHYVREGFESGEEFKRIWFRLHRQWKDDERVCVIRFVRL